ncbi:MAG: flagellar biosynthetic protein FliQ [Oceanospirillaceae bacterium]|uniref:flagellar biosynthesis protein FliQ n=1 Tax=Marinobacterium litorale TaxID=404770 RepID=UPI0004178446|nr:flagellar biosynthesis protein FliQ [Marinobacterium litorale]MBT00674.1 flagellar biosynthetic protein FliQ [Oceanospirillaceae bacterium]
MTTGAVLDLFGSAIWTVVLIVSAIVVPGLIVGLIVSVFQAATQINEQTLSFLPRLIVTLLALMAFGPWIVIKLMDQFEFLFMNIPRLIG